MRETFIFSQLLSSINESDWSHLDIVAVLVTQGGTALIHDLFVPVICTLSMFLVATMPEVL